ncbi:glutathione S-transferase theta-1a [Siniperca chuatsi]|uniref:glutathione S-transferase theta-1a n=1 Tax=Siniperca chuatsi TaxID=119488 RepID=UPI001CE15C90|nr:glutathione S-transferase theta-1a [Siniperca chuatsi]
MISAVFTIYRAKLRPKVRLLNHDGLLTLNCRHHLKINERLSEERRSSGQTEDNRRGRRGPKHRGNVVETKLLPSDSDIMELYLDLLSQPCRAVFLFAKAVGIPFEFKLVDLAAGQQYSEEFGKISIAKKVPVMKDGSFILTESVAILKYLVQKYSSSVADHWYPANLQQRARVNEYLSWQHMNLRAHGSKVFLLRVLFPVIMGSEAPKAKMDVAVEDLNQSLKLLEEKFLQNKPFIIGDKISLADLVAIVDIMQPFGSGLDVFEGRPKLIGWRERVKKELGEKLFDEGHELIMSASSLAQKMQNSSDLETLKPKFQRLFI